MEEDNKRVEDKLFFESSKIILKCDYSGKIKIHNLCGIGNKCISKLGEIIVGLNNIKMSKEQRQIYAENIKDICYIIGVNEDLAIKRCEILERDIEEGLMIKKKLQYVMTIIILFLVLIIVGIFLLNIRKEIGCILICGSLGGILGTFYKQDTLSINYDVDTYVVILEGIKRVLITIVVSTVGFIVIKANIILPNFDVIADDYTLALVIIVCGYSINFIPNILDRIILKDTISDKSK